MYDQGPSDKFRGSIIDMTRIGNDCVSTGNKS